MLEKGYRLSPGELSLELGEKADPVEVKKQADLISSRWDLTNKEKPQRPFLLMLGGFQGSGKTSVIELLRKEIRFLVISPDEIRHNLFNQNYPFSEDFVRLVNATRLELLVRALDTGQSIVLDQSISPDRIKMMRDRLIDFPNYHLTSTFLSVPREVIKQRVEERPTLPGLYRGTVPELEATMKKYEELYGEPSEGGYDLIIDTFKNNPEQVKNQILDYLVV
jgi:adenylylsulfate kinase-like enzyme